MKILNLLVVFILIIFPFGELLRFDVGNNIIIKPLDIVVGLTGIWWIVEKIQNSNSKLKIIYKNKFILFLSLFIFIGFLSLIINLSWLKLQEFFVSLLYLLRWIMYAGVFFVVSSLDTRYKKLIKILMFIDGLIILIFGYLQYFFYNSLRNLHYLGWDEHMHRIFSTFFDPNYAGGFFVLYFIFIGGIIFFHRPHPYPPTPVKQADSLRPSLKGEGIKIVGFYFILAFTLMAIFLTFSRASFLMLITSSVVFFILIEKKKLILGLLLAVALFGLIASPKFYDENMNLFRVNSSNARLGNYELALRIFKDHPVIGVGFNSYRYTKELYGLNHDWVDAPSHADAGVDNSFLFVLATTGIVGFSAYMFIWYGILKRAYLLYKKNKNIMAIVVISSTVGIFIHALFINSLFFAPIMLWMWILIGMMNKD